MQTVQKISENLSMALLSAYTEQTQHICDSKSRFLRQSIMSCIGTSSFPSTSTALPRVVPSHTSPEPPHVDSFISGILQAVTGDDLPLCSNCEEGISATSRCRDCSEVLCDPCVQAHHRVRVTKDHRVIRFTSENAVFPDVHTTNSIGSCSQASSTTSPCSANLCGNNFCELHHEQHRVLCETCQVPLCSECVVQDHGNHQLMYMQDALENAASTAVRLGNETRTAIVAVREAIDDVQRVSESVEVRAHQAINDVRTLVKRIRVLLDDREHELVGRIDQVRQMKGKLLMSQMENLRVALTKLARTSDLLNETVETGSGVDLVMANEKATLELKHVRCIRSELKPCEDECIVFVPPDNGLLRAISTMGNVSTSATSYLLRTRFKEPHMQMLPFIPPVEVNGGELNFHISGNGRGRPVYGVASPVVAKDTGSMPLHVFGGEGEGDGQLCRPWGVCCDRNGNIIVADRSNNRVQVFHPDGTFRHKFGSQGSEKGQFDRPAGVTVDNQDRIVVADKDNHRIQIFMFDGTFVLTFGEKGCRSGQFNYPWDVACNSNGQIVVSDTRNHRIQLFSPDGTFLNKYGFEGVSAMWKHFDSPRGVCFTPLGSVIVSDFNNHRIIIIDCNLEQAQYLGTEGGGAKQFLRPQGIICDDEGKIIVADSRNNRIQVFEGNGNYLWKIGHAGKGLGELDRPSGICLSPDGRIIVVDFGNNRVQIF